jgi:heme/copper-type cytochrome/quinol oxidase subunit 2
MASHAGLHPEVPGRVIVKHELSRKRKERTVQRDTHNFDLGSPAETRRTRNWIAIAGLGSIAMVLALIGADVVLINGAQASPPRPIVQVVKMSGTGAVEPVVYLSVTPGIKPAPDGKLHDAFSVTNFTVHAGSPVKLVINNTDSGPHSIIAPAAGVNILVRPGLHTYTLLVHRSGRFHWYCMQPCDPYSMSHVGYMQGSITSVGA